MKIFSYLKEKFKLLYNKMVGEEAPSSYIARGWAIGMFWGCTAPFGVQLMLSIPCAFILKGSKIGATIGTFITNHFSIFIIYPLQTYGGAKLMGLPLSYDDIKSAMMDVIEKQNYETLFSLGMDIAIAFFVGGIIMALVFTPITYFGVKYLVDKYRAKNEKK
jgi:uncharacterized protein (DUF2062 family)